MDTLQQLASAVSARQVNLLGPSSMEATEAHFLRNMKALYAQNTSLLSKSMIFETFYHQNFRGVCTVSTWQSQTDRPMLPKLYSPCYWIDEFENIKLHINTIVFIVFLQSSPPQAWLSF